MRQSEREALIEKLTKPEASDGAGMGVAGIGLAVLGGLLKPAGLVTIAGIASTIIPVAMVGISVTGIGAMALQRFLKRRRGH